MTRLTFGKPALGGVLATALLAGACALAVPGTAQAAPYLYNDTDSADWYVTEGWLDYVTESGLMTGYKTGANAGGFMPNGNITRGEVVTVLYRIANPDSNATTDQNAYAATSGFSDGNYAYYWNAAIRWASENGIVTGYTTGTDAGKFCPERTITRAELATMVYRFARSQGADVADVDDSAFMATMDDPFLDNPVVSFARDAMVWAADRGVITGNFDGSTGTLWLDPQDTATRAQAAKVFTVVQRDVLERSGSYTVAFEPNGGSAVPSQTVTSGNKAHRAYPTRTGYEFENWYSNKELTRVYGFDSDVTGNLTLYAKWTPVAETAQATSAAMFAAEAGDGTDTVATAMDEATETAPVETGDATLGETGNAADGEVPVETGGPAIGAVETAGDDTPAEETPAENETPSTSDAAPAPDPSDAPTDDGASGTEGASEDAAPAPVADDAAGTATA